MVYYTSCTKMDQRHSDVVRSTCSGSNDDDRGQRQLEEIRGYPLLSLLTTGREWRRRRTHHLSNECATKIYCSTMKKTVSRWHRQTDRHTHTPTNVSRPSITSMPLSLKYSCSSITRLSRFSIFSSRLLCNITFSSLTLVRKSVNCTAN